MPTTPLNLALHEVFITNLFLFLFLNFNGIQGYPFKIKSLETIKWEKEKKRKVRLNIFKRNLYFPIDVQTSHCCLRD